MGQKTNFFYCRRYLWALLRLIVGTVREGWGGECVLTKSDNFTPRQFSARTWPPNLGGSVSTIGTYDVRTVPRGREWEMTARECEILGGLARTTERPGEESFSMSPYMVLVDPSSTVYRNIP